MNTNSPILLLTDYLHASLHTHSTLGLPWVAGFLWSAPLQLLHQHLAAPSQGVTNLPEGAAATQRAVTILRKDEAENQVSVYWRH